MNAEDRINVVVVQYYPKHKKVEENIAKLEEMLGMITAEDNIDIVLFPEMALTGYIFESQEDIGQYLEEYDNGPTYKFCSKLAERLNSYVFCGYPEKVKSDAGSICLYNSCMIVNRTGAALKSYHKHFLYEMDKTWCIEGEDFGYMEITSRAGNIVKLGIGICMDLNPYEFKAPWDAMEFSNHCKAKDVDVILFLTNWLDNEPEKNTKKEVEHMISYWMSRLDPYFMDEEYCRVKPVYFCAADRCGKEKKTNFIGCSCIVEAYPSCKLMAKLDKRAESILYAELKIE